MNIRVTPILLLLLCLHGAVAFAQPCICNECPQTTTALNTTDFTFELDGANVNDLSDPGQGICEVVVNFAAEHIWSIEMTLTSPSANQ